MFDGLYWSSARQSLRHAQNGSISPALKGRDAIALDREVAAQMSDAETATAQCLDHLARSRRKRRAAATRPCALCRLRRRVAGIGLFRKPRRPRANAMTGQAMIRHGWLLERKGAQSARSPILDRHRTYGCDGVGGARALAQVTRIQSTDAVDELVLAGNRSDGLGAGGRVGRLGLGGARLMVGHTLLWNSEHIVNIAVYATGCGSRPVPWQISAA